MVIKQRVGMSSKRYTLMGNKTLSKRKIKRELENQEVKYMSITIFREGEKTKQNKEHYQKSKLD